MNYQEENRRIIKSFRLHHATVDRLEMVSDQTGTPQSRIIDAAVAAAFGDFIKKQRKGKANETL